MEKGIYLMNYSPQEFKELILEIVQTLDQKNETVIPLAQEKLLSRKDICEYLGIGLSTLHKWMNKGLPYSCINGRRYFVISEVIKYKRQINNSNY